MNSTSKVEIKTLYFPCDKNNKTIDEWNSNTLEKVKCCKPNVIGMYGHHCFLGSCYSFSKKGTLSIVDNSSVEVYGNKIIVIKAKQELINEKAKDIEKLCSKTITKGVKSLRFIIPDIKYILSLILDIMGKIQKTLGEVVLQEVPTTSSRCWNFSHV